MMDVKMVDYFDFEENGFEAVQDLLNDGEGLVIVENYPGHLEGIYEAESETLPIDLKVLTLEVVTSSNILSAGHLDDLLVVEFKGGSVYAYHEVPQDVIERWDEAASKGKYLASRIKGQFSYEMVS